MLRLDEAGDLVVGPEVLRLFDYYLSATGEERTPALHARIVAAIHRRIEGDRARGQAVALLDTYLGYREATRRLRPEGDDPGARFVAVKALRRSHFGEAVAEKLFGPEERALAVALEQRRALTDPALSPADRERRLEEAEAHLPTAAREARAAATRPLRERSEEEDMRAAGASDEDVRAYRVAQDGEEAADRLADLDRRRAEWQGRLAAFRGEGGHRGDGSGSAQRGGEAAPRCVVHAARADPRGSVGGDERALSSPVTYPSARRRRGRRSPTPAARSS